MALETFNYLDSLNVNNPVVSDGLVNGDDHLRGIKLTLKNSFPTINGAVTASLADLNAVAGGVSALNDAGVFFKTNSTDGFKNPAAGEIDLQLASTAMAKFTNVSGGAATFSWLGQGGITSTGPIIGPGAVPIGGTVVWWSDALPAEGGWTWANGGAISRADNPVLWKLWGTTFGVGDGLTTFNVPNLQEVVPVGKYGMGGGGQSPDLLNSLTASIKSVVGSLFGSDTVTLQASQIPPITGVNTNSFTSSGSTSSFNGANQTGSATTGGGGFPFNEFQQNTEQLSVAVTTGAGAIAFQSTNAGGGAHTNLQPSRVVNYIVRLG